MSTSLSSGRPELDYRLGLDGLRALAVLAVVGFHTGVFGAGWMGVDLFFALSGWLITSLLLAEVRATGRVRLGSFWARRARRLLPALGALLLVVTLLGAVGAVDIRRRGVLGAITYSTNWLNIYGGTSYWDRFAAPDPLEHLWSLAIEEQIYLVWPLVLSALVASGLGRIGPRIAAAGVAIASIALAHHGATDGWSIDRLYQGTDTRAGAFALGALFAGTSLRWLPTRARYAAVLIALAIGSWLARDGAGDVAIFEWKMAAISVCGLVAVLAAAGIDAGPLCRPTLRRIGQWSYGIYLFHRPIAIALDDWRPWLRFAVVALAAGALAAASYRLVEQPVRTARVSSGRLGAGVAATVVAVVVAVGIAEPTSPPVEAVAQVTLPPLQTIAAQPDAPGSTAGSGTVAPPVPRRPRVLILGDSVPALAGRRLVDVGDEMGIDVGIVAAPACVASPFPSDQFLAPTCTPFIESLLPSIESAVPDIVVWWWGNTGRGFTWESMFVPYCDDAGRAAVRDRTRWFESLSEGYRTVVVTPVPRLDQDDEDAAGTRCEIDTIRAVAAVSGSTVLALHEVVCPSYPDRCDLVPRRDGLHFTDEGAATVARWLFTHLSGPLTDP